MTDDDAFGSIAIEDIIQGLAVNIGFVFRRVSPVPYRAKRIINNGSDCPIVILHRGNGLLGH